MPDKNIKPENWFIMKNGNSLKNLADLLKEIQNNSDSDSFKFHMNNGNNDFANWLHDIFGLKEIAEIIRKSDLHNAKEMIEKELAENETEVEEKEVVEEKHIVEQSPEIQEGLKADIARFTQSSEEKLELINQMKKKINDASKDVPEQLDELEEEYREVYNSIAEARKEGIDVFMPALRMKNIKPKIAYFKASRRSDDFQTVKSMLNNVRMELKECEEYVEPDIKKEILEAAEKASE